MKRTRDSTSVRKIKDYPSRLSEYLHKGECGLPELKETARSLHRKLKQLKNLLSHARHIVVLTGAGISTGAGIPDFRGPNGVWTREKRSKNSKFQDTETTVFTSLVAQAKPTYTHLALAELEKAGIVKYVISQNVDGLHLRSGLPRKKLAELHGNVFVEKCAICRKEYLRNEDVGGVGLQPTGNSCVSCGGALHDTVLDWCDALPEKELKESEMECKRSDLVICLGTSLRILPVADLPILADKYVIINLQKTPLDDGAALVIREDVEIIMRHICSFTADKRIPSENSK